MQCDVANFFNSKIAGKKLFTTKKKSFEFITFSHVGTIIEWNWENKFLRLKPMTKF